jgi:hypothetical protein
MSKTDCTRYFREDIIAEVHPWCGDIEQVVSCFGHARDLDFDASRFVDRLRTAGTGGKARFAVWNSSCLSWPSTLVASVAKKQEIGHAAYDKPLFLGLFGLKPKA